MPPEKLDRQQEHAINANQGDSLYLWDSFGEKQNLTIRTNTHNDVLTVHGIARDQLASLYLQIAQVLGKPPEPTLYHLRQIHETIGRLIQAVESDETENLNGDFTDDAFNAGPFAT